MNREIKVLNGIAIIINDKNEFGSSRFFDENTEERLILENQREYLTSEIEMCKDFLEHTSNECEKRRRFLKKSLFFSIPFSILLTVLLTLNFGSPLSSISRVSEIVNNLVIITLPIITISFYSIFHLASLPSKVEKEVRLRLKVAKQENYKIKDKINELDYKQIIDTNLTLDNLLYSEQDFRLIDDRAAISRLEQICQLKLMYLNNKKRMLQMVKDGVLNAYFYKLGYTDPQVLASVENEIILDAQKLELSKKNNK